MAVAVEQIAQKLNLPLKQLMRDSMLVYVAQQERLAKLDIADLQDRYSVSTLEELSAKTERGEIYSHPAWEDLIEWEHLHAHIKQLADLRAALLNSYVHLRYVLNWTPSVNSRRRRRRFQSDVVARIVRGGLPGLGN